MRYFFLICLLLFLANLTCISRDISLTFIAKDIQNGNKLVLQSLNPLIDQKIKDYFADNFRELNQVIIEQAFNVNPVLWEMRKVLVKKYLRIEGKSPEILFKLQISDKNFFEDLRVLTEINLIKSKQFYKEYNKSNTSSFNNFILICQALDCFLNQISIKEETLIYGNKLFKEFQQNSQNILIFPPQNQTITNDKKNLYIFKFYWKDEEQIQAIPKLKLIIDKNIYYSDNSGLIKLIKSTAKSFQYQVDLINFFHNDLLNPVFFETYFKQNIENISGTVNSRKTLNTNLYLISFLKNQDECKELIRELTLQGYTLCNKKEKAHFLGSFQYIPIEKKELTLGGFYTKGRFDFVITDEAGIVVFKKESVDIEIISKKDGETITEKIREKFIKALIDNYKEIWKK